MASLSRSWSANWRCANCDELVFDYEADNQINRAFE
jgi:hypothetical protein